MWDENLEAPCSEWYDSITYCMTQEEIDELIEEIEYRQFSAAQAAYEDMHDNAM